MEKILEVEALNKFFGKKQALTNVSFSLDKGAIVGLIGPNGAGKTTIMKAILGLFTYQSGKITVVGQEVSPTKHLALEKVGALIEYPAIYPYLTGYQHLLLNITDKKDKARINHLAEELKMTGYLHTKAKKYSLGMKQKLGIALALLNEPELVILDEPMNGLDPQATKDLRNLILKLAAQGTSFLISSHILSELEKIANDVVVIDQGKVIKQASLSTMRQIDSDYILIKTSDDQQAQVLLNQANITTVNKNGLIFDQNNGAKLNTVLRLLLEAQLEVFDVIHQDIDLEASLLAILNNENNEG